jgi:predicted amidohydrolase YtcJ
LVIGVIMSDILFHGGTIYTLDQAQPTVEALLVRDQNVIAAGRATDVREHARSEYQDVPLAGRTVIPGLADAHIHLLWTGLNLQRVDLDGVDSLDSALEMIRQHAEQLPEGAWLRGHGWNHALWNHRWPTAQKLDQVTAGRPAILSRKDAHSVWVNTRALELTGINAETSDPEGGAIQRDEHGQPTGILLENAMSLIYQVVPEPTLQDNMQALREIIRSCHARGIVSVHIPEGPETLAALQALRAAGQLSMRCLFHPPYRQLDQYIELGMRSGFGDEWVRIGGVKIFSDGALGSGTCYMLEPFEGSPDNYGIPTIPEDDLFAAVRKANANGIAVTIHAIGDRANRMVLDAIEAARDELSDGRLILPNRIEHAQHLDPADVHRFAALGVIASMQPIHATSDIDVAERQLGPQRSAWSYAWRPIQEAGAVLAFGSDAPVETFDPWLGIHAAVTRQRQNRYPSDGWHPELAVDLNTTLQAYTVGPAIAAGEAELRGYLAPGKRADLVVLAEDPFMLAPNDLWQVQVEQTMVDGQIVWEKE